MTILEDALAMTNYLVERRRDFHRYPELGFEEVRTAKIVAETLKDLGISVTTGVAETGVVGLLKGSSNSPVLLLRFDMDALPIQEENDVPYVSQNPGKMHACGHDSHVAVGLGVAKLLAERRDSIPGTIKFVFQPAEEGLGGALKMVEEGVLKNPKPDYSMGMHVWNEKPVGWYALTQGPMMAGAQIFDVRIKGKGGHGAAPHQTIDPVIAVAQIITALQTITSRNINPLESAVVSVCQVIAGTAFNIIPQEASFSGTIRTFKNDVYETVNQRFVKIIEKISESLGCESEIEIERVTFPVDNDLNLTNLMEQVVRKIDPKAKIDQDHRTMGSEDFSYLMQDIPGCFMMVGSANPEKGLDYGHHHPKFNIDESCLPYAVAILTTGALEVLEHNPKSA